MKVAPHCANFDRLTKIQEISRDIGKLDSVRFEQGADADQDKTTSGIGFLMRPAIGHT
jgi:hypothetical protein